MPGPERFIFPRTTSGLAPRWIAVSAVAHAVVVALVIWSNPPRAAPSPGGGALIVMDLPRDAGEGGVPPVAYAARPAGRRRPAPRAVSPRIVPSFDTVGAALVRGGPDTGRVVGRGARPAARTLAQAVPRYGDGRLWVSPFDVPSRGRPIRMDSVVAARMLVLADSVERNPMPDPRANPYVSRPWTFRRNGKTYGWDAGGLHLGDFTIPTAALALLSLPQGNIDQARANAALLEMRADIMRAAVRAQAEEDFKQAVRDIRARRDRERREQRARDEARERLVPNP